MNMDWAYYFAAVQSIKLFLLNNLNLYFFIKSFGKFNQSLQVGTAFAVFNTADIRLPDTGFFSQLCLSHIILGSRQNQQTHPVNKI